MPQRLLSYACRHEPGHPHWVRLTETCAHMMSDRKRELKCSGKSYSMDTDLHTVDTFPANHLVACSDSSRADLKSLCPCEDCAKEHGTLWEANDSKRTTIGYVAMYGGSLVDHFTTTCPRTCHSTESELVASAAASKRMLAMKRLLQNAPMHKGNKLNGRPGPTLHGQPVLHQNVLKAGCPIEDPHFNVLRGWLQNLPLRSNLDEKVFFGGFSLR